MFTVSDHFNPSTIRALHRERPTLRFCCCEWMVGPLLKAGVSPRVIDVSAKRLSYYYPGLIDNVESVPLVHDVPNCGWKLNIGGERVFYATDTGTLEGISAPNYNLYLIEANYKTEELEARLKAKEVAGEYAYERRAAACHLSEEQAWEWLAENAGPKSQFCFLHQHREKGDHHD